MENYLVLIGDIEASRSVEEQEREELQRKLLGVLERLNKEKGGLVSPYTITLGDEFQAVFNEADHVFTQLIKILAAVHPVGVRFSLAVGGIDTPINNEQAIGMDGPAFHEAREGIQQLKDRGFLFNLRVQGEQSASLDVVNGSLQLLSGEMRGWNKRRLKILHMFKEGHDYKAISEALGISQPAFYKNKEAGQLDVIDELSDNIAKIINQRLKQ